MTNALHTIRKVRKFYQISLPARLGRKLGIAEGQYVQMEETQKGILVKPVSVKERVPIARFTKKEQRLLATAQGKMAKMRKDLCAARGLTKEEVQIGVKAGIIEQEQSWWWLESWQKRERDAEADIRSGRLVGPFDTAREAIRALTANAVSRKVLTKSGSYLYFLIGY